MAKLAAVDLQSNALGSLAASLRLMDRRAASRPFEPFDDLETAVLAALVQRICRSNDPSAYPVDATRIVRFIERYVLGMPIVSATDFRNLLVMFEYQPMVFGPRRRRFSKLSGEEQDQNLEGWSSSARPERRVAFKALKTMCMLAYWSTPETWPAIGYGGPLVPAEGGEGDPEWAGSAL